MKFRNLKYTWEKPFSSVVHNWSLLGADGAINFHVHLSGETDVSAGLEIHYFVPPDYRQGEAPDHIDCPYTGGRCWHDGTSLYATETLWPMIKSMLYSNDHETIFSVLEKEYDYRFKDVATEVQP